MLEELRLNNNHLIFLGMELAHMTSLKKLVLDMNGIFHVNTAAFRVGTTIVGLTTSDVIGRAGQACFLEGC